VDLLVASPFDYHAQALVAIPSDLPEPTSGGFENQLAQFLLSALTISQGRAFVLFTSFDLLSRVFERLREPLLRQGMTPLRQGQMNRHLLLTTFRKERNPVLFGTDSFWEGVDVQGKALELVVLSRLPFRVPTEPIIEARAEYLAKKGDDPFMHYTVPQAIIKFKQGFGRLIRSREDRGAVLICDTRVLTKNYGKRFLRSLPPVRLVAADSAAVLADMETFFKEPASSSSGDQ
jgi:ATP-dependent DNA helicase DinG